MQDSALVNMMSAAAEDAVSPVLQGIWAAIRGLTAAVRDAKMRSLLGEMLIKSAAVALLLYLAMQSFMLPVGQSQAQKD